VPPPLLDMSISQPGLPSICSVQPLRQACALSSHTDRQQAARQWDDMLKRRMGTPGEPPGRDVLPSLHAPRASAKVSTALRSVPPSSIGPSASVVAWFAQFQCEHCGKIPTSLEARFCVGCGEALKLPALSSSSGVAKSMPSLHAQPKVPGPSMSSISESVPDPDPAVRKRKADKKILVVSASEPAVTSQRRIATPAAAPVSQGSSAEGARIAQAAAAAEVLCTPEEGVWSAMRRKRRGHTVPSRLPCLPLQNRASRSPIRRMRPSTTFGQKERSLAAWLGHVRPRTLA